MLTISRSHEAASDICKTQIYLRSSMDQSILIEPTGMFANPSAMDCVAFARILEALFDIFYFQKWNFNEPKKGSVYNRVKRAHTYALGKCTMMIKDVVSRDGWLCLELGNGRYLPVTSLADLNTNDPKTKEYCDLLDAMLRNASEHNIFSCYYYIWKFKGNVREAVMVYFKFLYYNTPIYSTPENMDYEFVRFVKAAEYIASLSGSGIKFNGYILSVRLLIEGIELEMPLVSIQQLPYDNEILSQFCDDIKYGQVHEFLI